MGNTAQGAVGGKRFTLDGEPIDIAEFIADNEFDPDELAEIDALLVGDSITYGGGAFAIFILRREPLIFRMVLPFKDHAQDVDATAAVARAS